MTRAKRILKRLSGSEGNTILEAAVLTPLLLLLTFSIVDFGALFYVYLALENGASQATRYGITGQLLDDPDTPGTKLNREPSIKLAMRNATPTLTLPDSDFVFSHMPVGGSAFVPGTGGPGEVEKLTVNHTWTILNPIMAAFFTDGQIVLKVDSAMKNEVKFK
jgi:hypothetical protein